MLNKISKIMLLTIFIIVLEGCSNSNFSHKYIMRGQIISVVDDVIICVGKGDGAKVDQVLTSYRFVMNDDNHEAADIFKKIETGKVRIDELINEHYAKVTVINGEVKIYDTVELDK